MYGDAQAVVAAVIAALRLNAPVRAVCSGRIRTSYAQDGDAGTEARPILVVALTGGSIGYESVRQDLALSVEAYSRVSQDEALQVYGLAQSVLQAQVVSVDGAGLRVECRETGRPQTQWYPESREWCAAGRWQAISAG